MQDILNDYENAAEVEYDNTPCPLCEGCGVYLGTLGCLRWLRCQECGIEFNTIKEKT